MKLFKKAAFFTDIHLGAKGNSEIHNTDCIQFLEWMVKQARDAGCETCVFLGDYHNNRATMGIQTMHHAVRGIELLSENFEQTYFIPGNHDLFYRGRREVFSTIWAKHIPRIQIIHEPTTIGDVTLCPWLVGDEWRALQKKRGDYLFGHLELPNFYMNAMVKMPDHGEIQVEHLSKFEYIFSGHFHKRQHSSNVVYIGNPFPHNYSDAWDDERGMMTLEWGGKPEFFTWPDQPTFRTTNLSTLIDQADAIIKPNQYLKVTLDIDISFEEATYIKEKFMQDYAIREMTLIQLPKLVEGPTELDIKTFETVDQIVNNGLVTIQSDQYNANTLLNLYNNL